MSNRFSEGIQSGVFLGIGTLTITLLIYLGIFRITSAARIDVVQVSLNSALTLVLIGVYYNLSDNQMEQTKETRRQADLQEDFLQVQKQQAEIMDTQKALMRAQHSPDLSIMPKYVSGHDVVVEVVNRGEGIALNTSVGFQYGSQTRKDLDGHAHFVPNRIEWVEGYEGRSPTVLRPGDRELVRFTPRIEVPTGDDQWEAVELQKSIEVLQGRGLEEGVVELRYQYEDIGSEIVGPTLIKQYWLMPSDDPEIGDILDLPTKDEYEKEC